MAENKPHLHVEFFTRPVERHAKSLEAGRPIFEDEEFVKFQIAGDPKSTWEGPAHQPIERSRETGLEVTPAEKFSEHYRYFKNNQDQQAAGGTPLTEVPWLTASKREELKALKIFTVEGLAGLDGTLLQRLGMGGRELKNQASAWLDKAAGSAAESRMASQLAARDDEIEALKRQMADLIALQKGGGAATTEVAQAEPEIDNTASPFASWQDEDIKNWIKDNTGSRPMGNPSHATLVSRADEINTELAKAA